MEIMRIVNTDADDEFFFKYKHVIDAMRYINFLAYSQNLDTREKAFLLLDLNFLQYYYPTYISSGCQNVANYPYWDVDVHDLQDSDNDDDHEEIILSEDEGEEEDYDSIKEVTAESMRWLSKRRKMEKERRANFVRKYRRVQNGMYKGLKVV